MAKPGRPKGTTKGDAVKYLTRDELAGFFAAVRKARDVDRRLRDGLAFGLALHLGLRVGELAGLKVGDVDADAGQVRVKALKGGLTMTQEVPPELLRRLKAWMARRDKGSPWLFPGKAAGRPITAGRWKAGFKAYAARTGLSPSFSVHSLRHSCAVAMAERGASPIKIARWLRQRRASSAEKYFAAAEFRETGRQMEAVFRGILG